MEKTMHRGMLTYVEAAIEESKDLFKRPMKIPERGHYFWECVPPMGEGPPWLNDQLFFVPWRAVLEHPERPRCANCSSWNPLGKGTEVGICSSEEVRLGHLTPQEAFCKDYVCKKKSSNS